MRVLAQTSCRRPGFILALTISACSANMACGDVVSAAKDSGRKIFGGTEATATQVGATVALVSQGLCTGTLIAPTLVLTAAHCGEYGWDFEIVVDSVDAWGAPASSRHPIARAVAHPLYTLDATFDVDGLSAQNDIAILVLEEPIADVVPIPVLPMERVPAALTTGVALEIAGYGVRSETGQTDGTLYIASSPFVRENGTEILAGGEGAPDACYGDSGGPAYVVDNGQKYVAGVTSRGALTAQECGDGAIYTLASAYASFIEAVVNGDEIPSPTDPPDPEPGVPVGDGSCADRCGNAFDESQPCGCDAMCADWGDCCSDFDALCVDVAAPETVAPTPEPTEPEQVDDVDGCGESPCEIDADLIGDGCASSNGATLVPLALLSGVLIGRRRRRQHNR